MHSSSSLELRHRAAKIDVAAVARFSLFVLLGSLAAFSPLSVLWCVVAGIAVACCWLVVVRVQRAQLEFWQVLVLVALTGYRILNYGFENLSIHIGGIPIIISYGLMFASLAFAILAHHQSMPKAIKEPAMLCLFGLIVLTFFHLLLEVPAFGIWAIRDSSMCVDGVFLILGLFWAMKKNATSFLTKWLMVVCVINLAYSFTLPWGEKIWSWSPESGVFLKVPVLGNDHGTADQLAAGAVFCICIDGRVVGLPRWMMLVLAMGQLLGIAIEQTRRMYLGIVVVLVIFLLLGETKKCGKLLMMIFSGIVALWLLTSVVGLKISGRIGPVEMSFFGEHIRSISGAEDTPGSKVQSRFDWAGEAFQHFLSHPILGEGFGQPLLSDVDMNNNQGAITRTPHNSSLTYLARLGSIGAAFWVAFHLILISKFVYAFRRRGDYDKRLSDFILWAFVYYVLSMIGSSVEGFFEFPSASVPFYFIMGLVLGLIRWHLPQNATSEYRVPAFANSLTAPL